MFLLLSMLVLPGRAVDFPDVTPGSWYEAPVTALADAGALTGFPDGTFRPGATISWAEYVTIIARQAGLASVPTSTSHWAAGYLQAALNAGWYDWDELPPDNVSGWDAPISRQLAVKVVMKALLPDARGNYSDWQPHITDFAALNGRYYDVTFAAYAAGVAQGDDRGQFRPAASLTRAEACALIHRAVEKSNVGGGSSPVPVPTAPVESPVPSPAATVTGGVSEHGWLHVEGTQLTGEKGEAVALHGMSSHGLQWYGQYASKEAMAATAAYGANVYRVAMYTAEGGYLSDKSLADRAFAAVDAAIENDLYVILDWHILSDGNPQSNQEQAVEFFDRASKRYAQVPNVLYEICNEPNGGVTWTGNVKPYAQAVIPVIRANSPQSVILVGSPTWSQDLHEVQKSPLEFGNVMYTLHFYAGTHGQWLRDRVDAALKAGLPVFVSEWGTSRADGSGGVFLTESAQWLDFLDSRGISWCNWSLCDKGETSAALRPGAPPSGSWSESDLSESGRFVFSRF